MHIGVNYQYGSCSFSVWAPYHKHVTVKFPRENQHFAMEKSGGGYWGHTEEGIEPNTEYMYELDGKITRPDPASHFQPSGVFGPSAIIDHELFHWSDNCWKGLEIKDLVFYELHIGTFTNEGTFKAAMERIKELVDLGINCIELMPITQFSGKRNWGYDGVFPFSVHNDYGKPNDFKNLVNECHKHGIAVFIDNVYNHIGPEGSSLNDFGPYFPINRMGRWGPSINLDGELSEGVRNYFLENTLHWYNNYHVDGIRLDSVRSMSDNSPTHFLQELNIGVDRLCESTGKKFHLIAECGYNILPVLTPIKKGGFGFDAQWLDDFQHAVFALLTGEKEGYYSNYGKIEDLAEIITEGYLYIIDENKFRRRRSTESFKWIPANKLIVFSQNHDQIGNRLLGDRLITKSGFEAAKLAAGIVLLSPYVPLLFMGEEYGEKAPFLFFTDYQGEKLAVSIGESRKREFASFHWIGESPDPQSFETFSKSKLDWKLRESEKGQRFLSYYQALINLRKSYDFFSSQEDRQIQSIFCRNNILFMQKHGEMGDAGIIANCNNKQISYVFPFEGGTYVKGFDSADFAWSGSGSTLPPIAIKGDEHIINGFNIAVFFKKSGVGKSFG